MIGNPLFGIMKKRCNTRDDKENNNMDRLKLSDNIIRLRHERKITQEELANFMGVTKENRSAVSMGSSWEILRSGLFMRQ